MTKIVEGSVLRVLLKNYLLTCQITAWNPKIMRWVVVMPPYREALTDGVICMGRKTTTTVEVQILINNAPHGVVGHRDSNPFHFYPHSDHSFHLFHR